MGLYDYTIYNAVMRNARLLKGKIALVYSEKRVSYAELGEMVDRLAAGLVAQGVKEGDRIAVVAQNCVEFFALYVASARIGAVVVPINWRLAEAEIEYILSDCAPVLIFAGKDYQETMANLSKKVPSVKKMFSFSSASPPFRSYDEVAQAEPLKGEPDISSDAPFIIIYTAAVAGKPRGAVLTHQNIIARNIQARAVMNITEKDVHLLVLPLFHIAGLGTSFAVLHAGGTNVVLPKFDPMAALQAIEKEKVTMMGDFPPILNNLLERLEENPHDVSSLRCVTGLDRPDTIKKLKEKTGAEFWTGFGQTETTGFVTLCAFSEKPGSAGKEGPLAAVKLVDDYGRDVETGKPGEIVVRGPLVFKGYWNLPSDTDYTFRGGWHHTGDIGRFDEDGFLWYVKRKAEKELIKPGGENVYPAEVEEVIFQHPDVEEVSVIGVKDPQWGEAIKAVCVLRPGRKLSEKELIDFVASRIARYKKPKYVEFVDALPRTSDGDVDREKVKELWGDKEQN